MGTAKLPGGFYKGVNGKYHDANNKPIPQEIVDQVLGAPAPVADVPAEAATVIAESVVVPEAPVLTAAEKRKATIAAKKAAAAANK